MTFMSSACLDTPPRAGVAPPAALDRWLARDLLYPPPSLCSSYNPPPSLRCSHDDDITPRGLASSELIFI